MGDFKKLRAWHEAKKLALLSKAINRLPPSERYALADQWKRCAYSVALNIAEGSLAGSDRAFRRYLNYARGSLQELEAILELCESQGHFTRQALDEIHDTRANCARMVFGLIRTLST